MTARKILTFLVLLITIALFAGCTVSPKSTTDQDETTDVTVDETVDESADETTDETIDETVDETADESIDESIDETTDETTDETIDETIDETADETVDETVDETADETVDADIDVPYTVPEITSTPQTEGFKAEYPYSYSIVCSDPDGDDLTITIEDNYCNGVLTDNGDGTATYEVEALDSSCSFNLICSDSTNSDSQDVYFSTLARFARVKDIKPGSSSSNPSYFNEVQGMLVFYALDGAGSGYYTSDGTSDGTVSFYRQPAVTSPIYTKRAGNKLFASQGQGQLWTIDGTELGTKMLVDVCASEENGCSSSSPIGGSTVNGNSIFIYSNHPLGGSPWTHQKVWASDGTIGGTGTIFEAKDIGASLSQLTASQGKIFFKMSTYEFNSETGHGSEVMYMDTNGANMTLTKEIRPDNGSFGSTPDKLTDIGNKLLFTAYGTDNIKGLYATDLSLSGEQQTIKVTNVDSATYSINKIIADKKNNRAFLILNNVTTSTDGEIWITNGTAGSFTKLGTFNKSAVAQSASEVFDGILYFGHDSGDSNYELWKSDGTAIGTVKITDIPKVVKNMIYSPADSRLYYSTTDDLFYTDGTDSGSDKLSGINVSYNANGFTNDGPNIGLYIFGDDLFIAGRMSSSSDTELYRYGIVW